MRLFSRRKPESAPPPVAADDEAADLRATEADIRACFRLLLGRDIHPEEQRGHLARAGDRLEAVVASFLGSLEFTRRGLLTPPESAAPALSELSSFRLYTADSDPELGHSMRHDAYEPDVTAVFRRFLRPGMGVVDIGANIGWFTMLSAALVGPQGWVLAIEPNPGNARLLEASRRANGFAQVQVAQVAAGAHVGLLALHSFGTNGTTSPPSDDMAALFAARTVPAIPVDALVGPSRPVDFIKADVEGAEYTALLGAAATLARCRPVILSEFSPNAMPDISGVTGAFYLQWLIGQGYHLAVIEPDGSLTGLAADWQAVLRAHQAREADHIDILARPAGQDWAGQDWVGQDWAG